MVSLNTVDLVFKKRSATLDAFSFRSVYNALRPEQSMETLVCVF
jgi:hypothetical protein